MLIQFIFFQGFKPHPALSSELACHPPLAEGDTHLPQAPTLLHPGIWTNTTFHRNWIFFGAWILLQILAILGLPSLLSVLAYGLYDSDTGSAPGKEL